MANSNTKSGIYLISILTIEDGRNVFDNIFEENVEQGREITRLKDVLPRFMMALGSSEANQRDELTALAAGNFKIVVEWGSSLVGMFFISNKWSQAEETRARVVIRNALREIELVYQDEIENWLDGQGDLSLFSGLSAMLGRFFSEYSLIRIDNFDPQDLLQHPSSYYLKLTEKNSHFVSIYLESRSYRHFLDKYEIAGETAHAIVREILTQVSPIRLILKTPLIPPDKIITLLTHLISRGVLELYRIPITSNKSEVFYTKLDKFLTKMRNRENLGPPANAFYTSRTGDCFNFVWTKEKDCVISEGKTTGCKGKVFNEGNCCDIFINQLIKDMV